MQSAPSGASALPPQGGLTLDVPVELIKDPRSWTVEDISIWLHWLGIGEHAETFAARGVDGQALLQLSAESDAGWEELGVVDAAQRHVLDSAVEPLRIFQESDGTRSGLALHAIEGPVAGDIFFVGAGGITGGRHSASNGIVLSENYVSRRHFQISKNRAGEYFLQDVGSTTGTFLMVKDELLLDHLMVLQLGTTELTVRILDGGCTLVATEGPDKDAQANVPPEGLIVGREASNGLCIRDPQISAFHCEVRRSHEHAGFVLDDKYSTNRTWLRLAPDGQPSRLFPLSAGDLFKVGSTLFHVVDPSSILPSLPAVSQAVPMAAMAAAGRQHQAVPMAAVAAAAHSEPSSSSHLRRVAPAVPSASVPRPDGSSDGGGSGSARQYGVAANASASDGEESASGSQLRWEPMAEDVARPVLPPEEYAARLTASRRRMQAAHADASRRALSSAPGGAGAGDGSAAELHMNESTGMQDLEERELSSLQQRMSNVRAQTAYTLQQQRPAEAERGSSVREEDLCKICYDRAIDIVLYPCGHFVLCRWCAQRVSDCPLCRFVITDIIRTYRA